MVTIVCDHCGKESEKPTGAVNRAKKIGSPMFCNRTCTGLHRRTNVPPGVKIEAKRLYDIEYRRLNLAELTNKKAAYFKANYNPEAAAIVRKKRMPAHLEYCRQPAYRAKKKIYDRQYRAKYCYGEFWEAYLALLDVEDEVDSRMDRHQIRFQNETYNKTQRRHRHEKEINREELEGRTLGHAERR